MPRCVTSVYSFLIKLLRKAVGKLSDNLRHGVAQEYTMTAWMKTSSVFSRFSGRRMPSFHMFLLIVAQVKVFQINAQSLNKTKHGNELRIGMTILDYTYQMPRLEILSEKMGFKPSITHCSNFEDLVKKVWYETYFSYDLANIYESNLWLQTSNGTFDAGFAKLSHLHHRYCSTIAGTMTNFTLGNKSLFHLLRKI